MSPFPSRLVDVTREVRRTATVGMIGQHDLKVSILEFIAEGRTSTESTDNHG